jgi:hypothetical protein
MILMASRDLSRSPLGKISHSSAIACMRLDEATTLKKPVDRLTKCQVLGLRLDSRKFPAELSRR